MAEPGQSPSWWGKERTRVGPGVPVLSSGQRGVGPEGQ